MVFKMLIWCHIIERFELYINRKEQGDDEAMELDENFITAFEYGLPHTAWEGIGIDRLVMMLANKTSIREVIPFPSLKTK